MSDVERAVGKIKVEQAERQARLRATQFYREVVDGLSPLVTEALQRGGSRYGSGE